MFLYSHGTCGTVAMIYGEKYDSFNVPRSVSTKAKAFSLFIIT